MRNFLLLLHESMGGYSVTTHADENFADCGFVIMFSCPVAHIRVSIGFRTLLLEINSVADFFLGFVHCYAPGNSSGGVPVCPLVLLEPACAIFCRCTDHDRSTI